MDRLRVIRGRDAASGEDVSFALELLDLITPLITDDDWEFIRGSR